MIAVIGLGAWGSRHATALVDLIGAAGVIGVDPCPERRAEATALGLRTVPDITGLPGQVTAAVVATPSPSHATVAASLLNHDIPVLVEKPLAETVADARGLVELATDRKLVLMVGHVFLFQRGHQRLRQVLNGFGPVRLLAIERRTPGLVKPESGAWTELGPHEVAAAIDLGMLTGPVVSSAFLPWSVTGLGQQDGVFARLQTGDDIVEVTCSWLSAVRGRRVWAVAEHGQALLVDTGQTQRLAAWAGEPAWTRRRPTSPQWKNVSGPAPLKRELETFLAAVREGGEVRSDGWLGLRVVEMMNHATETEKL